mgnify:CR=1 FL=1
MINMFQVQKWAILEKDFSIPGGELGKKIDMLCSDYYKAFSDVYVCMEMPMLSRITVMIVSLQQ